jgi:RNA-splicing ligase RtcB
MEHKMIDEAARAFFADVFAQSAGHPGNQAIVNLAFAQLQLEDLIEGRAEFAAVIVRPDGAASSAALRGLLAAAEPYALFPQPETIEGCAKMLTEGYSVQWPPMEDE